MFKLNSCPRRGVAVLLSGRDMLDLPGGQIRTGIGFHPSNSGFSLVNYNSNNPPCAFINHPVGE